MKALMMIAMAVTTSIIIQVIATNINFAEEAIL